jgi:hypothetical protein
MTESKKNPRRKSARTEDQRQPIEIAVVFTGPEEAEKDQTAATPADSTANEEPLEEERASHLPVLIGFTNSSG